MGIVNRRNAVVGWIAWQVGKRVVRRKARSAVPSVDRETKRPNKPLIAAALATVAGVVFFWRRGRGEDAGPE
jgi:hypothetical protein